MDGGGQQKCRALCKHKAGICRIARFPPQKIKTLRFLKPPERDFVGGALGLQKVLAPNQSSSVSTRAEPFTRYASDKEHEEGMALINACGKGSALVLTLDD